MAQDSMQEFFEGTLDFGRCRGRRVSEVFTAHRQYFDQILYKNHKFRHEYARAYALWQPAIKAEQGELAAREFLLLRIRAAMAIMGAEAIDKLFASVIRVSHLDVPDTLTPADTLPGGSFAEDPANSAAMEIFARFWQRLALPIVREE